jgi:hypothetical protein
VQDRLQRVQQDAEKNPLKTNATVVPTAHDAMAQMSTRRSS